MTPICEKLQLCERVEKDPWKNGKDKNWDVIPNGLDVLELGSEEAVEIVLDDEDAEEVGVAAGAENVPGESGEAETGDGDGMKAAKGVAPAFCEDGPEKNGAAGEDDGGGTFGEGGEAEKKTEGEGSKGGRWGKGTERTRRGCT